MRHTFFPKSTARIVAAKPPGPLPITARSNFVINVDALLANLRSSAKISGKKF
jgi:hypothetical protein